ncbi:MAG: aldolase [Acidobacteria bacterium]|nr:aldolase [Acidobacteriota bacterium]
MRSLSLPSLRGKLTGTVRGVFCELPCPEALEIIGIAGWDFAVVDCEHAPITVSRLPGMVRAAAAAGMPAIVRVASNSASAIQHALDCGAAGVQIPQIASLEAARSAVAAARFHPEGQRGFNPFVRAAAFSAEPVAEFLARSNRDLTLVLQIESAAGLAAVDAILEIEGIDVLFIGPYDLSQSLGIPGETAHPRVYEAGARLVESASRAGVAVGVFANTEEEARRWRQAGVRYLCFSVDTVILLKALRAAWERLK